MADLRDRTHKPIQTGFLQTLTLSLVFFTFYSVLYLPQQEHCHRKRRLRYRSAALVKVVQTDMEYSIG